MNKIDELEERIKKIEERNARVEANKGWEVSWTRRLSVVALTYAVIVVYLLIINNDHPFIYAAVPAVGFFLSTLVLRRIRELWQKNQKGNI